VPVLIGTSGWHYQHWKGGFYPPGLPARTWLEYYARRFATVELNNAFYRLPERTSFDQWAASVPDDFVVAVKASRYLTHVRRLQEPHDPVALLLERAAGLGPKLGPVLVQLPPTLRADPELLDATLAAFPRTVRVAVEFRHPSWFTGDTRRRLEARGAALCLTDVQGPRSPAWATAGWGYVRFHAGRASPPTGYGGQALDTWAERLANLYPDEAPVHAYFNNDGHGCAPRDARRFARAVSRAGRSPSRVPAARETPTAP